MDLFRLRLGLALWLGIASTMVMMTGVLAVSPANDPFQRTWARTDRPVADQVVNRTWMWGPEAFTVELLEPYEQSPNGERSVQYFDKSRMEITRPLDDPNTIWYVSNGLLVMELMTGEMQLGHETFEQYAPAQVNVAGDSNDPSGPTYATFGSLLDLPPLPDGEIITQRVDRNGVVTEDPSLAGYDVTAAQRIQVPGIDHQVASPFWTFMNSTATVYEGGGYVEAPLFESAFYATGVPVTEAYWATVKVANTYQHVLIQCFERRCLTYNPMNGPGWQVEAGNVGQHYYQWRYGDAPAPGPEPSTGERDFTDGFWFVGVDIEPGIYRNSDSSNLCYWARYDWLDNVAGTWASTSRMIVEIEPGDIAFESIDCGTWSSDTTPITPSPTTAFGDGTYFVNAEVSPGIWRSSGGSDACYWERMSGFSGTVDDVLAATYIGSHQVVEISAGDAGFHTNECGTWTYGAHPVTSSLTADIGDGIYIVGVDIQPGVWMADEAFAGCYWEIVDGFGGTSDELIDWELIEGSDVSSEPMLLEIFPDDTGFGTEGCGPWTYLGP